MRSGKFTDCPSVETSQTINQMRMHKKLKSTFLEIPSQAQKQNSSKNIQKLNDNNEVKQLSPQACSYCGKITKNNITKLISPLNWIWCLTLSLTGFCCLAFCVDAWKIKQIKCNQCQGLKRKITPSCC